MKFCDCLKIMYFHVKLVAKSENNKIKAIGAEPNGEKIIFSKKITQFSSFYDFSMIFFVNE